MSLKSAYTGIILVLLSAFLTGLAFYAPYFGTRHSGSWILSDFPMIMMDGLIIPYVPPIVATYLVVAAVAMSWCCCGEKGTGRLLKLAGVLAVLLGFAGAGAIYFVDSILHSISFDGLQIYHMWGYFTLWSTPIFTTLGGLFMILFPVDEEPSVKAKTEPVSSNTKAKAVSSDKSGTRRRKGDTKPAAQASDTKSPTPASSANVVSKSVGIRMTVLLFVLLALIYIGNRAYNIQGGVSRLKDMKVPEGFEVSIYAKNIPEARTLVAARNGVTFVGTRRAGYVYALLDIDGDFKVDLSFVVAKGLQQPNGLAVKDGALYIADIDKVYKIEKAIDLVHKVSMLYQQPYDAELDDASGYFPLTLVYDAFPSDEAHGWRYMSVGPDGRLYIAIGAPCNVCIRNDTRYATIMRETKPGSLEWEVFASGIRNSVGFDWHPETKELWFTENGRDWLAHNYPPDELCRAPRSGLHFGFPYCFGDGKVDPEIAGGNTDCTKYEPPVAQLAPHAAALGVKFYTGNMFPSAYKNVAFIAEHGSWNRVPLSGYRVMKVTLDGTAKVKDYSEFMTGFITRKGKVGGRPVDIAQLADGSLLVSDDYANRIYRVTYSGH